MGPGAASSRIYDALLLAPPFPWLRTSRPRIRFGPPKRDTIRSVLRTGGYGRARWEAPALTPAPAAPQGRLKLSRQRGPLSVAWVRGVSPAPAPFPLSGASGPRRPLP